MFQQIWGKYNPHHLSQETRWYSWLFGFGSRRLVTSKGRPWSNTLSWCCMVSRLLFNGFGTRKTALFLIVVPCCCNIGLINPISKLWAKYFSGSRTSFSSEIAVVILHCPTYHGKIGVNGIGTLMKIEIYSCQRVMMFEQWGNLVSSLQSCAIDQYNKQ